MKNKKLKSIGMQQLFIVVAFMFISISTTSAQRKNSIKLIYGTQRKISLDFEKELKSNTSLTYGLKYYDVDYDYYATLGDRPGDRTNKGLRLQAEYRYYLFGRKPRTGIYIGPHLSLGGHKIFYTGNNYDYVQVMLPTGGYENQGINRRIHTGSDFVIAGGAGLKLGYQVRFGPFVWEIGALGGYNTVFGKKGIYMDDGDIKDFNVDMRGQYAEIYTGIGISF